MAEVVIYIVCHKLQASLNGTVKDVLLQEGQFLYGVSDKVAVVQRELGTIRSFLNDLDSKSSSNYWVRNWVNEVRDFAYLIEDAVDTFEAEVDWINNKERRLKNFMKKFFMRRMLLPTLHQLSREMDDAQGRILEINESRLTLVTKLDDGSSGKLSLPIRPLIHPRLSEMEMKVVGFESDKANIIGRLLDKDTSKRSVVSIVGPGGIGKTILAQTVYNNAEVKDRFEILIWLSVSEEFNLIDLLKKMLENLQHVNQQDYHESTKEYLIMEICKFMKEKKYLVVMDDIWEESLWEQLQKAFPDVKNGSRVLITSRFVNVAKKADPNPHQLDYLNEEQSMELLLQKAFLTRDPNEVCPQNLKELAREFAKQCGGLPLQLVVLGDLLSRKMLDYLTWESFMHTIDWVTDGKICFDSIRKSYKHLPLHLKSCFMSLSVFPEDYKINVRSLISYWSIEGFIPQDGKGTMDKKAQGYLDELVQRCMVEVTSKTKNGIIERCRVHTLLRILAVHESKEKGFITIFGNEEDYQKETARHASFHYYGPKMQSNSNKNKDVIYYTGPNVRTLMFFRMILPIHSQMKLLKVLIAYRTSVTFYYGKHTWLENLISLKHLEFRDCKLEKDTLPEKINCLHCLEYLDLTDTKIVDLPKNIKCNEALKLVANMVGSKF